MSIMRLSKSKRGLLKPFIIAGILILFLVSILLFIHQSYQQKKLELAENKGITDMSLSPDIAAKDDIVIVNNYIERCLRTSASEGIQVLGSQGGYIYQPPGPIMETDFGNISYAIKGDDYNMPSSDNMETEIASYVENNVLDCINDFAIFQNRGYSFNYNALKARAAVRDEKVVVFIDFPTTVWYEGIEYNLEEFGTIIPIRLGHIIDITEDIMKEIIEHDAENDAEDIVNAFSPEYLSGMDAYVSFLPTDKGTVFVLHDEKSRIDGEGFEFLFAVG